MGKNKKKKNIKKNLNKVTKNNSKKEITNHIQTKKILDGVDLANSYNVSNDLETPNNLTQKDNNLESNQVNLETIKTLKEDKEEKIKIENSKNEASINSKFNLNEHIQSFISLLFTIIIFVALIMLIYVIYNNYLKKDQQDLCDVNQVCQEYIKKDYQINKTDISNYIKNLRGVIYNLDHFDSDNITNADYLNLATYLIWSQDTEYIVCNQEEDSNCLITKKEIKIDDFNKYFSKYFNIQDVNISYPSEFQSDDKTRIYLKDDKIILTFSEFVYQTLKHDIVDIIIDEDNIRVIFALSKQIENSDLYTYVGYKNLELKYVNKDLELKYVNKDFLLKSIKTSFNN